MRMFHTVLEHQNMILLLLGSHTNIPSVWVTLSQHLLTSVYAKICGNMSIGRRFDHVEFLRMSSYAQYFFGAQKYEL